MDKTLLFWRSLLSGISFPLKGLDEDIDMMMSAGMNVVRIAEFHMEHP